MLGCPRVRDDAVTRKPKQGEKRAIVRTENGTGTNDRRRDTIPKALHQALRFQLAPSVRLDWVRNVVFSDRVVAIACRTSRCLRGHVHELRIESPCGDRT